MKGKNKYFMVFFNAGLKLFDFLLIASSVYNENLLLHGPDKNISDKLSLTVWVYHTKSFSL